MANDLGQILLGRVGMEARPAPDNMQHREKAAAELSRESVGAVSGYVGERLPTLEMGEGSGIEVIDNLADGFFPITPDKPDKPIPC